MLTDEEIKEISISDDGQKGQIHFARSIERAVLAKSLAQQERLHKEWSELWSPIDDAVRPLTPLGESVAARALELINMAKAMPIPKQEPLAEPLAEPLVYIRKSTREWIDTVKPFMSARFEMQFRADDALEEYCIPLYAEPQPAQAADIPDGYVLVPLEPSAEQQTAGAQAIRIDTTVINKLFTANRVYREMLSASPKPE